MLFEYETIFSVISGVLLICLIWYLWLTYTVVVGIDWIPGPKEYPIIRHAYLLRTPEGNNLKIFKFHKARFHRLGFKEFKLFIFLQN